MLSVKLAADNWDIFTRTERLALLRMLPFNVGCPDVGWPFNVGCPDVGWAKPAGEEGNQWAKVNPIIQHALLQLDWEFALGRRIKGFSNG